MAPRRSVRGVRSRSDGVISPACRRYIDLLVNEISKGGKYRYDTVDTAWAKAATSTRRCRTVRGPSPSRPSTNPPPTAIHRPMLEPLPVRIHQARRAATIARMTGAGMPQDDAERWCAAVSARIVRLILLITVLTIRLVERRPNRV
jgi:hypothetical protein